MPRSVERSWGLALSGGWHPNRVPADRGSAVARAGGAALFQAGARAGVADTWASAGSGRGREERGMGGA
jgi:hypothetical protein